MSAPTIAGKPAAAKATPGAVRASYARSRDTRARILAAALEEASEVGFHKTSVARIASRAGVALGNVNYHFGSKRDLLRELMVSLVKDLRSRIHAALGADCDDFFGQERAGLLAYLGYLRENPAYARLGDEVKLHEPELYRLAIEAWVEQFSVRVRAGIERGYLRQIDDAQVRALGFFLFGSHQFLDRLIESEPSPTDETIAEAYLGLMRGGLARAPHE